jgi:ABC-type nitrate/sulfonate/bicarbonate transport system substrate-binding protein
VVRLPRLLLLLLAIPVLLLLSSPGGTSADCEAEAAQTQCTTFDEVRVQLRWLKNGQFAGFYAAQDLGYYTQVTMIQRISYMQARLQVTQAYR